ncbi:hypothetical protein [Blastococcus saxobsidens]|uniref:Uncharacterized protein n=1 Tax=Blastococcus saxobsidens (strain DD2) TaxID=1146883 RepID=H6RLC7_BLASD|nr:hypothetical protein [Blastococcus saxobsidens]CCG02453.1 conserved protein of unknown function [Blastococcus saxobsidens DD2]
MTIRPYVLIIDDDPAQEAFALQLSRHGVDADHVFPDDVSTRHLERAALVLIDEYLERWPAREKLKDHPTLFIRDGVALAAVLRAQLEHRGPNISDSTPSRTAVALRTGHLSHLASGLPRHLWSPAVASRYDLEWVAEKSAAPDTLAAIALAAAALPETWDPTKPVQQREWLSLADTPWAADALAQIEQCRPPWSTLSATSAGRLWLAWFLQKVLPFPTFLVDDLRAAAYLGLREEALDQVVASATDLSSRLGGAVYTGQLSGFAGRRWWRAGLAAFRRQLLAESGGRGPADAAERIIEAHGAPLEVLGLTYPVFTIDRNYQTSSRPIEVTDALRLQPDGWPSYADDPWLARDDVDDEPELAKLIVLDDRQEGAGDAED